MFRTAASVLAAVCAVYAGSAYAMQRHEEPSFVGDREPWFGKSDPATRPGRWTFIQGKQLCLICC